MALSDDRIFEIAEAYGTLDSEYRRAEFARAIEDEAQKQDTALIRQMLDALAYSRDPDHPHYEDQIAAIDAARKRLEGAQ